MKFPRILMLLALVGTVIASTAPAAKKNTFVVASAKDGEYAPWRAREDSINHYAGEIITLSGGEFRYFYTTDVVEEEVITPDWRGSLKKSGDHIYLDHPGVPFPYRITGYLDGVFVMTTWRSFEHWKKFGTMKEYDVLYLQTKKEPNQSSQPTRGNAPRG